MSFFNDANAKLYELEARIKALEEKSSTPKPPEEPEQPPSLLRKVRKGQTIYLQRKDLSGWTIPADVKEYTLYGLDTYRVTKRSWEGSEIGDYNVIMRPNGMDLLKVKIPLSASAGTVYDFGHGMVQVTAEEQRHPFPMYIGMESWALFQGYRQVKGDNWGEQGPLTKYGADLMRSFGIEPTKHTINFFPKDISSSALGAEYSYDSLVFQGNLHDPLLWAGEAIDPDSTFMSEIAEIEDSMQSFIWWGIDEAGTGPSGLSKQDALDRIAFIRQTSGMPIMQTGKYYPEYALYDNVWHCTPNVWTSADAEMEYPSCMGTGNCINTDFPNKRSSSPVLSIEGDPVKDWMGVVRQAKSNMRSALLYFNATQKYPSTLGVKDDCVYSEGNQGDGTLLWINPDSGYPDPDIRLAYLHEALQEAAHSL